jgi:hypothetical protein
MEPEKAQYFEVYVLFLPAEVHTYGAKKKKDSAFALCSNG